MDIGQKYCLQWNEFTLNVSTSIKNLRDDNDFTDVTLTSRDKQQFAAHKVILSASSMFFRDILKGNKHPHPLIYMKDINAKDLSSIIDFIYNGEVSIIQEDLENFLSLAQELELQGLKTNSAVSEELVNKEKILENKFNVVDSKNKHSLNIENSNLTNLSQLSKFETYIENNELFSTEISYEEVEDDRINLMSSATNEYKELDDQIETMMEKIDGGWQCRMCGKVNIKPNSKQNMKTHVESIHMEGGAHPCNQCGKIYRSRHSLQVHIASFHRKKSI